MKRYIVKFLWALLVAIIILVVGAIIEIVSSIRAAFGPDSDDFGRRHAIPANFEYNEPLMEGSTFTEIDSLASDTYLQIYNDYQGGMYLYDFHYPALPAGEVFLKCYEATENIALSKERIEEASRVQIEGTTQFTQLANKQEFTIHEGVWGDYYAARIEVWHRNADTGEETKLLEKIYRVEGWQR